MKNSGILKTALLTSACLFAVATTARAENFNIPGGDLKTVLDSYSAQTGQELLYAGSAVKGVRSQGAKGDFSADTALTRLLSGTGFRIHRDASGAIAIVNGRTSSANEIQPLQLAQATPAGRIEEVLVTARRREEAIENIPISITALSAEDLKTFGVRNFADLEGIVPGLNLGGGGNGVKRDSSPFIRGVGQRETKVTLDPAVATYIDGIYIGRGAGAMLDVTDVASIQVLRGPQGTLFGRNATGGAISVSLQKPTNNWEASVTANIGNYGRRDLSGVINVPFIEDKVMGRLFIASINSNGYFTNIMDNKKWGGDNRITGIGQLRILPTDRITIDLLAERTRIRETPRPQKCAFIRDEGFLTAQTTFLTGGSSYLYGGYNLYEGLCRESQALPQSRFSSDLIGDNSPMGRTIIASRLSDIFDANSPRIDVDIRQPSMPMGRYWVDTTTFGGTANWDIGDIGPLTDFNAKSITAWRKTKQIADEDLDAIGGTYLIRVQPHFDQTTQFSQELQFSGKTLNDRLFLNMGAYYFKEKTPNNDLYLSAGLADIQRQGTTERWINGFEPVMERLQTDNHAWAWYGQADLALTPQIELTAGIRWTTETHWSRYSKGFADITSVVANPIRAVQNQSQAAGQVSVFTPLGGLRPVLDWRFGAFDYTIDQPVRLVLGELTGDELTSSSSAWTPMFSAKYKADDSVLQKLSLDQAMLYATYSVGFHSGGVTSGALDFDARPGLRSVSTSTGLCPPELGARPSCSFTTQLPGDGYGTADPITFEPEKVTNYEVGFKVSGLDRRLQLNVSAFYMNYTNMQVTAAGDRAGVPVPYIENVGKSVIKGIELEAVAMPSPQWRILMNGSYTDADIKEWEAEGQVIDPTSGLPTTVIYSIDRSDERMPRVPRWQFFASSEYSFNLGGGGTITPSVGVRFTSSIYHGFDRGSWVYTNGNPTYYYNRDGLMLDPFAWVYHSFGMTDYPIYMEGDTLFTASPDKKWLTHSRPAAFLDARISWMAEDGKMEAALWGKNLFNKDDYMVGGIPLPDVNGATGQVFANPRTFGLTFTYHFGE